MNPNPVFAVDGMWRWLVEHQPAVAAALILKLRDLPDDWPSKLFGVSRSDAVLSWEPDWEFPALEVAPPGWLEDCPACDEQSELEVYDFCRFHTGYAEGYEEGLADVVASRRRGLTNDEGEAR